jgi:hypothetical protein
VTRAGATFLAALASSTLVAGPVAAQASDLQTAARSFAGLWAEGDASAISAVLHRDGVLVALLGVEYGTLDRRNAEAALRDFLQHHEATSATLARASEVGGTLDRGFAEIRWEAVAPGTSEPLRYTVFTGFVLDGEVWRVTDLRVL